MVVSTTRKNKTRMTLVVAVAVVVDVDDVFLTGIDSGGGNVYYTIMQRNVKNEIGVLQDMHPLAWQSCNSQKKHLQSQKNHDDDERLNF
jgi:hypothetical protein